MNTIHTTIDGVDVEITPDLIEHYDKPLPRYTSYPTAPLWKTIDKSGFTYALKHSNTSTLSLYIHLPFCRSRCTFCACHAIATTKTDIIDKYIDALALEMNLVHKNLFNFTAQSLHLGGGTPTYLSQVQIERLMLEITKRFSFSVDAEVGIEADPRETTVQKISLLRKLGFNRISFGIQDTNPQVQRAIGRVQDFSRIKELFAQARKEGFIGINIDLCYGLPSQKPANFNKTLDDTISLSPDRIALFSFAFVPWMQSNQRKIDIKSLPTPKEKLIMFASAIEKFAKAGYQFIGLDHFAKKDDQLSHAFTNGNLKRTFQGYSVKKTDTNHTSSPFSNGESGGISDSLIGFGVTAISDYGNLYTQNERKLSDYLNAIEKHQSPVFRGFKLSKDDLIRRDLMQRIFCRHRVDKLEFEKEWNISFDKYFHNIDTSSLEKDGLIVQSSNELHVTPLGRLFIRNVASLFDAYLEINKKRYSKAI